MRHRFPICEARIEEESLEINVYELLSRSHHPRFGVLKQDFDKIQSLSESDIVSGIQLLAGPWDKGNERLSAWSYIKDLSLVDASTVGCGVLRSRWKKAEQTDVLVSIKDSKSQDVKYKSYIASRAQYTICASVMSQRNAMQFSLFNNIFVAVTFLCHFATTAC